MMGCGHELIKCPNPLGIYQGEDGGATFTVIIDGTTADYQLYGKLTFAKNGKSMTCKDCTFTFERETGYVSNNCGQSFDSCLKPLLELVGWTTDYYPYISCYDDGTMYFVELIEPNGAAWSVELERAR
ncbi:hypothetical protein FOL47_004507 [Perkinsus chesapeaki]|uniref:Uncharacterized protein n=1 Tax=Perkinsus chesapeaki TaxID=330153 RepID=A0A7J6M2B4_PERCH|nr:hypothetical protein FOL47_004507 [Perkinsus chesapeaki]